MNRVNQSQILEFIGMDRETDTWVTYGGSTLPKMLRYPTFYNTSSKGLGYSSTVQQYNWAKQRIEIISGPVQN